MLLYRFSACSLIPIKNDLVRKVRRIIEHKKGDGNRD